VEVVELPRPLGEAHVGLRFGRRARMPAGSWTSSRKRASHHRRQIDGWLRRSPLELDGRSTTTGDLGPLPWLPGIPSTQQLAAIGAGGVLRDITHTPDGDCAGCGRRGAAAGLNVVRRRPAWWARSTRALALACEV
jgi:hypothetical protein